MAKRIYISTDMDRWDSLAYDFYGDASLVAPLMAANPQILPAQVLLPAGAKIIIPEVITPETKETTVKAPWK